MEGYNGNTSGAICRIDDISITGTPNGPNISAGSISGSFSACYGTASSERTFSVQGGQLTNDQVVITAPPVMRFSASSGSDSVHLLRLLRQAEQLSRLFMLDYLHLHLLQQHKIVVQVLELPVLM